MLNKPLGTNWNQNTTAVIDKFNKIVENTVFIATCQRASQKDKTLLTICTTNALMKFRYISSWRNASSLLAVAIGEWVPWVKKLQFNLWALVLRFVNLCVVSTSTITFLDQNWYLFTILAFDMFECLYLVCNTTRMNLGVYIYAESWCFDTDIFQFNFLIMVNASIETCANDKSRLPL